MAAHVEEATAVRGAEPARCRHELLLSGIGSGVLGGLVMAVFLAMAAAAAGLPALRPLTAIGATFVGPEALGTAGAVLYGATLHLLTSAVLGLAFAAMVPRDFPVGCAAVVGSGYSSFVLGVMMSFVVPAVNPLFRTEMQPLGGSWVIAHALFGATLGAVLALRWRLGSRSLEQPGAGATEASAARGAIGVTERAHARERR